MISYTQGDLLKDESEAIVNTVNCVGVMGRGIALQFRNAFPENYKAYAKACKQELVQPGQMFVTETGEFTPRYTVNFPTKRHWRGKSRVEDVESGLEALVELVREKQIRSIAIPPLGSGLGGLDWKEVKPLIESAFAEMEDVNVVIYEPGGAPSADKMVRNREVPKMTPGRAALVGLMHSYLSGLLDPFVTLLEVHKLMYFMQEAGEPLRLKYVKGPFGPFGENLGHVLKAIEGHLVTGYADGGDSPIKQLKLVPGAPEDARRFLETKDSTREHFAKVADLVGGFETPFGLELFATVHWVVKHERPDSFENLVERTYAWGDRKRQFTDRQIELAAKVLVEKSWLPWDAAEG